MYKRDNLIKSYKTPSYSNNSIKFKTIKFQKVWWILTSTPFNRSWELSATFDMMVKDNCSFPGIKQLVKRTRAYTYHPPPLPPTSGGKRYLSRNCLFAVLIWTRESVVRPPSPMLRREMITFYVRLSDSPSVHTFVRRRVVGPSKLHLLRPLDQWSSSPYSDPPYEEFLSTPPRMKCAWQLFFSPERVDTRAAKLLCDTGAGAFNSQA